MTEAVEDPVAARAERGPGGRLWVYAVAFVLLLVSAYLQFSGAIGTGGLTVVWSSIALSAATVGVAAAAVLAPGKRLRPAAVDSSAPASSGQHDSERDGSPVGGADPTPRRHVANPEPEHGAPGPDGDGEEAPGR